MYNRKFIGARYVPVFADEPWSADNAYEPLTVVIDSDGDSYTSRQYVPTGILLSNGDYWAKTGAYNAQFEQLVDTVDNRLTAFETNALFIGNSYTDGVGATNYNGMYKRLKKYFTNAYKSTGALGGNGFGTYTDHNETFLDLLEAADANTAFDSEDITHIFFMSAMGDTRIICEGNDTTIYNNMTACTAYAATHFPNAKIYVCYLETVYGRSVQSAYSNAYFYKQYRVHWLFENYCRELGIIYLGWLGWNTNQLSGFNAADNYHPNDAGYDMLESAFRNAFFGVNPYKPHYFYQDDYPFALRAYSPTECSFILSDITSSVLADTQGTISSDDIEICDIVKSDAITVPYAFHVNTNVTARMPGTGTLLRGWLRTTFDSGNSKLKLHLYGSATWTGDNVSLHIDGCYPVQSISNGTRMTS